MNHDDAAASSAASREGPAVDALRCGPILVDDLAAVDRWPGLAALDHAPRGMFAFPHRSGRSPSSAGPLPRRAATCTAPRHDGHAGVADIVTWCFSRTPTRGCRRVGRVVDSSPTSKVRRPQWWWPAVVAPPSLRAGLHSPRRPLTDVARDVIVAALIRPRIT
jgi:hypothetical protein